MPRRYSSRRLALGLALSLLAILTLAAQCAAAAPPPRQIAPAPAQPELAREAPTAGAPSEKPAASTIAGVEQERKIIYTGELSLVVKDTQESIKAIEGLLKEMDGYIASSELWRQEDQLRGRLTVRVPAERFAEALERLKGLALKVERQNTSSKDVTEEYTDLNARLRNLEATETELRELLRTVRERTGKAEEILAVHQRLSEVRGEIEQVKGRMQYLERLSALATITIELTPDILSKPIIVAGWRPQGTAAEAVSALIKALQLIVDVGIWFVLFFFPILLVLLLPFFLLFLLWRWYRRRRRTKSA